MHVTEHAHTRSCAAVCLGMQVINQQVYPYAFSFPSVPSQAVLHVLHMLRSQKGQGRNYWIPKDRWSKASIISASSSLLLFSDHEKPSELGTYTLIQQLFTYQRLKPEIKSERKTFHAWSKQAGNQSPFSVMAATLKDQLKFSVQAAGGFRLQCSSHAWIVCSLPFSVWAAPSTKKFLSKQSIRITQMFCALNYNKQQISSYTPVPPHGSSDYRLRWAELKSIALELHPICLLFLT